MKRQLAAVAALPILVLMIAACSSSSDTMLTGEFRIADQNAGAVTGIVLIESVPVPGVTVSLQPEKGAASRVTVTDARGEFSFTRVTPGAHTLLAELEGMESHVQRVIVKEAIRTTLAVDLRHSGLAESITVTAQAPVRREAVKVDRSRTYTPVRVARPAASSATAHGVVGGVVGGVIGGRIAEEPFANEEYAHVHANRFVHAGEDPVSTFSIDVDSAAYANVRRFIRQGVLPPPDAVRIEEMVNYFRYDDPAPQDDGLFAVSTEVTGTPWNRSNRLVRIALRARNLPEWEQRPNNLVFLIDVSGSMQDASKLPLLKRSFRMLVEQLDATDTVAIVTYSNTAQIVLRPTPGDRKWQILEAIDRLRAEGSTAGARGIQMAYDTIREVYDEYGNNRVILATDGDFNVGVSSREELERLIERERERGIFLSVLGFGTGNLKDAKMEVLADRGNGNYAYIDSILEARKSLVEEIGGTLQAIASDVKIQVEFDPRHVAQYKLIGYENRLLADADFEDDTKDAGELGSGHSVTALYEIVPAGSSSGARLAEVRLRYKPIGSSESTLVRSWAIDDGSAFEEASSELQFAAAVARYGMILRSRETRDLEGLGDVLAVARRTRGVDLEGYRSEFIQLVETTMEIAGVGGRIAEDRN